VIATIGPFERALLQINFTDRFRRRAGIAAPVRRRRDVGVCLTPGLPLPEGTLTSAKALDILNI
jgi:hypothetical protein